MERFFKKKHQPYKKRGGGAFGKSEQGCQKRNRHRENTQFLSFCSLPRRQNNKADCKKSGGKAGMGERTEGPKQMIAEKINMGNCRGVHSKTSFAQKPKSQRLLGNKLQKHQISLPKNRNCQ